MAPIMDRSTALMNEIQELDKFPVDKEDILDKLWAAEIQNELYDKVSKIIDKF